MQKLLAKFKEVLSSRKFWLATAIAALAVLKLDPITLVGFISIVQVWLGTVLGIGLVQGTAERIGGLISKK